MLGSPSRIWQFTHSWLAATTKAAVSDDVRQSGYLWGTSGACLSDADQLSAAHNCHATKIHSDAPHPGWESSGDCLARQVPALPAVPAASL
jgi:hypothetical protein